MANPIEENEELARAVGVLAGRWGLAEFYVEFIFALVVGTNDRKATILFSFFKSVENQCQIIDLMLDETPGISDTARECIKEILKDYKSLSAERNSILHCPFGWDFDGLEPSVYKSARRRRGDTLRYTLPVTVEGIMSVADRIDALVDSIASLMSVEFWKPAPSTELTKLFEPS